MKPILHIAGTTRPEMPPLPLRMQGLPRDHRGYPVPWFVKWIRGKPDFRVMDARKRVLAVNKKLCWVCGHPLGIHLAFIIGPMCAINRVSGEPPSHRECALFSARACPFLTRPEMHRVTSTLPDQARSPGGTMVERNPGVTLVWVTKSYKAFKTGHGHDWLIQIGDPEEMLWYAHGRMATVDEIAVSIATGLPALREIATAEGPEACVELEQQIEVACKKFGIALPP